MYCWLTIAQTMIMISYGSTLSTAFLKIMNVLDKMYTFWQQK